MQYDFYVETVSRIAAAMAANIPWDMSDANEQRIRASIVRNATRLADALTKRLKDEAESSGPPPLPPGFIRKSEEQLVCELRDCPKVGSKWRHVKTQEQYVVLGRCIIEASNEPAVLYARTSESVRWVRALSVFRERFLPVAERQATPPMTLDQVTLRNGEVR